MCVVYTLHEHALTRQQANVWMMVPKRVAVTSSIVFMPKFFKRRHVAILFEEINYPASNDAVDITKDRFRFLAAIGDEMKVVQHDDVSKDQKASGLSCFVEGIADDGFDLVSSEDWKTVFCDGRELVGRRTG